jgi:ATP/maltotriose-dependent transcriptional regulator MalT
MPRTLPHLRPSTIARPRLLVHLERWEELRLVEIIGPAGCGKTTLARLWVEELRNRPRATGPDCAWVAVEASTDADLFVRHLTEACLPFAPALQTLLVVDGSGEYTPQQRIQAFCALLRKHPPALLLVIDDLHLLPEAPAQSLIQQLLDDAPDGIHLMLVSRSHPQLQVDELILRDAIVVIDERDLAFDHDEFVRMSSAMGIGRDHHPLLDRIESLAGGWATGIKLMLHDLQTMQPGAALPSAYTPFHAGERSILAQFFHAKILDELDAAARIFLETAAVLPWLTTDLVAAVLQRPTAECEELLHTLVRRGIFFIPDEDRSRGPSGAIRCRLHTLFQDFLRRRLALHPDDVAIAAMRARAADWLIDQGCIEEAFALLKSDAELLDRAGAIARSIRSALLRHDLSAAQRMLSQLPESVLAAHAELAVDAALYAYITASPTITAAAERAMAAVANLPPGELRCEAAALSALAQLVATGSLSRAAELLPEIEQMPHHPNGLASGYLHVLQGWVVGDSEDPERCAQLIQSGARIFMNAGFQFGAIEALISHGIVKRRRADPDGALASLAFAQVYVEQSNWTLSGLNLIARYSCGDMLYLLDRIDEARAPLQQTIDIHQIGGLLPEIAYLAHIDLTLCECAQAPHPESVAIDDDADAAEWLRLLSTCSAHIIGLVAAARILRDFRLGRIEGCRHTLENLRRPLESLQPEDPVALRLALVSGAVLTGRFGADVRAPLDRILEDLHGANFHSQAIHVRVLQAIEAQSSGDADRARRHLQDALVDLERTGLHRLILDYPNLLPTLRQCSGVYVQRLLIRMSGPDQPHQAFQLTAQERRILRMLCDDLTPEQIADALTLGITTIHSHLRRIYRKLNVHSRFEAIRVARAADIAHLRNEGKVPGF